MTKKTLRLVCLGMVLSLLLGGLGRLWVRGNADPVALAQHRMKLLPDAYRTVSTAKGVPFDNALSYCREVIGLLQGNELTDYDIMNMENSVAFFQTYCHLLYLQALDCYPYEEISAENAADALTAYYLKRDGLDGLLNDLQNLSVYTGLYPYEDRDVPYKQYFAEKLIQQILEKESAVYNGLERYLGALTENGQAAVYAAVLEGMLAAVPEELSVDNFFEWGQGLRSYMDMPKGSINGVLAALDEETRSRYRHMEDTYFEITQNHFSALVEAVDRDIQSICGNGSTSLSRLDAVTQTGEGWQSLQNRLSLLEHVYFDAGQYKGFEDLFPSYDRYASYYKRLFPNYSYGDFDRNGRTDAADALGILQFAVGIADCGYEAFFDCDVDGNAMLDALDALLVLKRAVGKIDRFPVELMAEQQPQQGVISQRMPRKVVSP